MAWAKGSVEVRGTSTLHDWTMVSNAVTVTMEREGDAIEALTVSLPVNSLKSGDAAMDGNAYEAFDADPETPITFTLFQQRPDGSLEGLITIGSHKKRVIVMPDSVENGVIRGAFEEKMSSFGVKPPTFLFGAMRTGDAIEIHYRVSE
jgi:hypothetical protein